MWTQEDLSRPRADLETLQILLPRQVDAVAIAVSLDEAQGRFLDMATADYASPEPAHGGDEILVVGYGYSAQGTAGPEPIFVRRAVTAQMTEWRLEVLLDGVGARGISWSPVYRLEGDAYKLPGVYTGAVHPDHRFSTPHVRQDLYSSPGAFESGTGLEIMGLL